MSSSVIDMEKKKGEAWREGWWGRRRREERE